MMLMARNVAPRGLPSRRSVASPESSAWPPSASASEVLRRKSWVTAMPMDAKARDVRSHARNVRSAIVLARRPRVMRARYGLLWASHRARGGRVPRCPCSRARCSQSATGSPCATICSAAACAACPVSCWRLLFPAARCLLLLHLPRAGTAPSVNWPLISCSQSAVSLWHRRHHSCCRHRRRGRRDSSSGSFGPAPA